MKKILTVITGCCLAAVAGCIMPQRGDEAPIMTATQLTEPAWIRNGESIVFEGETWIPTDEVENLMDSEVYQAGTYRDVPFFIEKIDVRPFERLYTHFSRNRYRAFEQ